MSYHLGRFTVLEQYHHRQTRGRSISVFISWRSHTIDEVTLFDMYESYLRTHSLCCFFYLVWYGFFHYYTIYLFI